MVSRRGLPTADTLNATAIIRCFASISSGIWSGRCYGKGTFTSPTIGEAYWNRLWRDTGRQRSGSSVATSASQRASIERALCVVREGLGAGSHPHRSERLSNKNRSAPERRSVPIRIAASVYRTLKRSQLRLAKVPIRIAASVYRTHKSSLQFVSLVPIRIAASVYRTLNRQPLSR